MDGSNYVSENCVSPASNMNNEDNEECENLIVSKTVENEIISQTPNVDAYGTVNVSIKTDIYPTRWYILFILCGGTISQILIWGTWGPISDSVKFVYGWDTTYIFILTNCANIGSLLPLLFVAYIVQRKVPSQVSEVWFPLNERTTATTIAVISNAVGGIVTFVLGPNIVSEPGHSSNNDNTTNSTTNIPILEHSDVFGMSAVLFISTLIYYPSKPKYPPSVSAAEVRLDFREGLIQLIKQPEMWQVTLACTVPCAVFGNWITLSYFTFKPVGVSQSEAGWFGFSSCVGGAVGGLIIGGIASNFQQRMKWFILSMFGATILTMVWLICLVNKIISPSTIMVGIAVTLLGIFSNNVLALSYEVACETGYPIHEGVIGTLLTFVINAGSVLFLMVQLIPNIGTDWMTWTLLGSFIMGFILLLTLKEKYKRFEIDISHARQTSKNNKQQGEELQFG
ncbi:Solute carrier 49 member 4 [Mactra antiquata]